MKPALQGLPSDEALKAVESSLKGVTPVVPGYHRWAELFVLVFRENFMNLPYRLWQGASTSNWTYHTAFEIRETAEILGLDCVFETMGKHDAIVQTPEAKPRVTLVAEWESDYTTVFGKGQEIAKLWKDTSRRQDAHAMLFTYCPSDKYSSFLKQVVRDWQGRLANAKRSPSLFLLVVLYQSESSFRWYDVCRATEILRDQVKLWYDLGFPAES
jgi:hypothetical protein